MDPLVFRTWLVAVYVRADADTMASMPDYDYCPDCWAKMRAVLLKSGRVSWVNT